MKTKIYIILLSLFAMSCSEDSETTNNNDPQQNKVLMLQVDFTTNTFEGGKEYTYDTSTTDFTISSEYHAPGDFGNIALYYDELGEMLFDGSIIWMGLGSRSYPQDLTEPSAFAYNSTPEALPSVDEFEKIMYNEFAYYPETIDYDLIWNAIDDLQIVSDFRNSNPNSDIQLLLYTPSVGVGDPIDWDWIVFLKN